MLGCSSSFDVSQSLLARNSRAHTPTHRQTDTHTHTHFHRAETCTTQSRMRKVEDSEKFMSSNFHIVWASKTDIGYYPLGRFQVKNYGKRFCNGFSSKDEITKTLKTKELPNLRNPKKGLLSQVSP